MSSFLKDSKSLVSDSSISIPTAKLGDIIGERISYNNNGQLSFSELSTLSKTLQMYSDKKYETARYLFVQKGEIVRHIAVSSQVPSSTVIKPDEDFLFNLRTFAEKSDTQVIFVHNHPSGLITPSKPDIALTKMLEKHFVDTENISRFAGHIILDHGSFGLYTPSDGWKALINNELKEITEVSDKHLIQDSEFGIKITDDLDLMTLAEKAKLLDDGSIWNNKIWIPTFFCTVHGIIKSHDYINVLEYQNPQTLAEKLKFIGRDNGCESVYFFPHNKNQQLICESFAQETGMIKDIYYEDEHGYELSDYAGGNLFHNQNISDIIIEDTIEEDTIDIKTDNITKELLMKSDTLENRANTTSKQQDMEYYDFEHDIAFTEEGPILTALGTLSQNPEQPIPVPDFKMLDNNGDIHTFSNMEIVDFNPDSHKLKMITKDNSLAISVNKEILLKNLKDTTVTDKMDKIAFGNTIIPEYFINENLSFKNMVIQEYEEKSQKYILKTSNNTEISINSDYFKSLLRENLKTLSQEKDEKKISEKNIEPPILNNKKTQEMNTLDPTVFNNKIDSLMETVNMLMKKLERAEEEKTALYKKIDLLEDQAKKQNHDNTKVGETNSMERDLGESNISPHEKGKKFSKATAFIPNTIVPKFGEFDQNSKEYVIYDKCRFSKYLENKEMPWESKVLLEIEREDGSHLQKVIPAETYQRMINATEELEANKNDISDSSSWDWMKIHQNYREQMKIDQNEVRINTSQNFMHNFRVMCKLKECANLEEAMEVAKHIVGQMQPAERQKFNMMRAMTGAENFDTLLRKDYIDHAAILDKNHLEKIGTNVSKELEELNRRHLFLEKGEHIENTNTSVGDKVMLALHTQGFDGKMRKTPKAEFEIISVSKNFGRSMTVLYSPEAKSRYTIPTDMLVAHIKKIEREKFKEEKKQIKKDHKTFGFYEGR